MAGKKGGKIIFNKKEASMKCLTSFLCFSIVSVVPGVIFGADGADKSEKKPSDAESFMIASFSALLNISTATVAPQEACALKKEEVETFAIFKKACANNDLLTIQCMLAKKEITSEQAGMAVWNLGKSMNDKSLKAISSVYPYAVWDAQKPLSNKFPHFRNEYIITSLNHDFILPYQRFDPRAPITYTPILNYFVSVRKIIQQEPQQELAEPNYDMVERLLQRGANPHFKGYYWETKDEKDAFYFAEHAIKKEEGEKLLTLLKKYAKPANEKGEFNTTDMFYPGTVFYREIKKDTKKG